MRNSAVKGFVFEAVADAFHTFYEKHLPFDLTGAQKRVLKEIRRDMRSGMQMNRLLQGDVGSGKTMVAALSALIAIDNGFQVSIMAPTEILAKQHYETFSSLFGELPIQVDLLTGSTKTARRRSIDAALLSGELHVLIGTHALLEDRVQFKNIGLAVIDEQHRFGVAQRAKLWRKNSIPPHVLVMTATPIPRTLAMTLYGDLDVSVIDELPPGRKPVHTSHATDRSRIKIFNFMEDQIRRGRQVYIVYPLIEESATLDLKDLMDGYEGVARRFPLPNYQISIVHGRMKAADKAFEMERFARGETQIMVATTVIEVGVNVPNASIMVIESAQRFGLSQLHQLRGRVGRGADQSYCILVSDQKLSKEARLRLKTMTETNDGFKIAEVDLKLRGPGDLMGTQQSGLLDLKLANLAVDSLILQYARNSVIDLLEEDPALELPENAPVANRAKEIIRSKPNWSRIS
jgi:ATP-dependent DNA helicase RecG